MQTSFKKRERVSGTIPSISGTQPSLHNGQLLCSTGVPSLDSVIGGGIPVGSVFLVEEDKSNQYVNLLTRYFMAEGVMSNHELFLLSNEDESSFINHLPEPVLINDDADATQVPRDMKIAWRYQNLAQVQTSMGKVSKYGHYYDISKLMEKSRIEGCKTSSVNLKNVYCDCSSTETFDVGKYTLKKLHKFILENKYDVSSAVKSKNPMNILRIIIPGFTSPFWGSDVHCFIQFLNCLRTIIRDALAVCWLTAPAHLHPLSTIQLVRHNVDTVIRLEAFGQDKTNPLYKEYHGLLHIEKLPVLNCLMPYMPDNLDLAFKLRRKKFSIERLHLPPDIGETDNRQRVGDNSATASGRASTNTKSSLDF